MRLQAELLRIVAHAAGLAALLGPFGAAPAQTITDEAGQLLIDLREATNFTGEIGDGGFDAKVKGGTWLVSDLLFCGDRIARVGAEWATKHKLSVLKDDRDGQRVFMLFGARALDGAFELSYEFRSSPKTAQVKFRFFDTRGAETRPELIGRTDLEVDVLRDALKEAMECRSAS